MNIIWPIGAMFTFGIMLVYLSEYESKGKKVGTWAFLGLCTACALLWPIMLGIDFALKGMKHGK